MYKYVVAAAIRRNETITLCNVEPLHGPAGHVRSPNFETRTDRKVNSTTRQGATEKAAARALTSKVKPRMRLKRSGASLWSFDDRCKCLRRISRNGRSDFALGYYARRRVAGARKA